LREPVPIVGQEAGRFGSTPPKLLRIDKDTGAAGAAQQPLKLDTNSTGKAKL
jgi:hypothetical protein